MKYLIYDEETYPNIFTLTACFENGKGMRTFEISSRRNDLEEMLEYFRKVKSHKMKMVGFNNLNFDYPVLHFILEQSKKARQMGKVFTITAEEIYAFVEAMFANDNPFHAVRESDVLLPQVDLFKIHHFDNKARMTSLKILEVRMLSDNVADLPFPVGKILTEDEMDVLIEYNIHDVLQTLKFFNESLAAIDFREKLTEQYGFDCTNFNDTKIGKQYFINRLEKQKPGSCYYMQGKQRKMRQTRRDVIHLKDVMLPYLDFKRPEFKAVHEWFARQSIRETKGVFSDLLESDLGSVAQYAEMTTKRKKINNPADSKDKKYVPTEKHIDGLRKQQPLGWVEEKELKSPKGAKSYYWCYNMVDTINVVVEGLRYDYGVGGIHACVPAQTIRADDESLIRDADVTSLYPRLSIVNRIYPKHLGEMFCDVYSDVFDTRQKFSKGTAENAVMKLALNGTYGESNNEFSPFYDPQFTMAITVGGQLTISMLIDRLLMIEGIRFVMANTDGVTVKLPRDKEDQYKAICEQWEKDVKLNLEYADYEALYQRDVNNYIWVKANGEAKRKGVYEYEDLDWHKDQSALVVRKAVEHELLGKGSAESFINKHDNKYDFLLATKVPRSSRLILVMPDGEEIAEQNVCRYYPSVKGGKLIKVMPPLEHGGDERRLGIDVEYNVKVCNNIVDFDWDVDYNYYINEARKLIDPMKGE
jgi:hypothetical protein